MALQVQQGRAHVDERSELVLLDARERAPPALEALDVVEVRLHVHADALVPVREVRLEVVVEHRSSAGQVAGLPALIE